MARSNITGLPQPRTAKARTVRKVVRLEPAEHRAQVAAAKRAGKTWSDWIRELARVEMAGSAPVRASGGGWVRDQPPDVDACDLCVRPTRWRHSAGGRRCDACPRPAGIP